MGKAFEPQKMRWPGHTCVGKGQLTMSSVLLVENGMKADARVADVRMSKRRGRFPLFCTPSTGASPLSHTPCILPSSACPSRPLSAVVGESSERGLSE